MAKVVYAESFIKEAQMLLRKMIKENLRDIPYVSPFDNFTVVIGNPENRLIIAVVDIPDDLKDKLGDEKVYVVN